MNFNTASNEVYKRQLKDLKYNQRETFENTTKTKTDFSSKSRNDNKKIVANKH